MKLMTKAIAAKLVKADLALIASEFEKNMDEIIVKYFNPVGAGYWYITSATPLDATNGEPDHDNYENAKDWHMFGYVDLGMGPANSELGYVLLSELEGYKGPFGLGIERDLHYDGGSLKELLAKAA